MGETLGRIHLHCECVEPDKLCASKTHWWGRQKLEIPIPKEERGDGSQTSKNLARHVPLDLKA